MAFPSEVIERPQWTAWFYQHTGDTKPRKVFIDPKTRNNASSDKPETWATHAEAVALIGQTVTRGQETFEIVGVGYTLTADDPYVVFDLDNPFSKVVRKEVITLAPTDPEAKANLAQVQEVLDQTNSFSEMSPSNNGVHIWVRGVLPNGKGRRFGKVEVYDRLRFMTCTGNHLANKPLTIEDGQAYIDSVISTLPDRGDTVANGGVDGPDNGDDRRVYEAALAKYGDDFVTLWNGGLRERDASGSEGDMGLASFLALFTDSRAQLLRLLMQSHRTERDSMGDDSERKFRYTVDRAFHDKLPPISGAILERNVAELKAQPQAPEPASQVETEFPPGLIGDIATWVLSSAPRPIREVALAAAIGLMGGMAGRAYNTYSGSGLNQFVVLIAPSSYGKDHARSSVNRIISALKPQFESIDHFLGPQHFASGGALYKAFDPKESKTKSFVSFLPEFGETMEAAIDAKASPHVKSFLTAVMDIYSQAGMGNMTGSRGYSNADNNVSAALAPSFSFVGDTVPGSFYRACTPENIEKGLIPRFILLEYKGDISPINYEANEVELPAYLLQQIEAFAYQCHHLNTINTPVRVSLFSDADKLFRDFGAYCDEKMRLAKGSEREEINNAVWGRAWLKAQKLATLVAVGENFHNPCVTLANAVWALGLTVRDAEMLIGKLDTGEIATNGSVSDARHRVIINWFKLYVSKEPAASNNIPTQLWQQGIMPLRYLWDRAKKNKAFRPDNRNTRISDKQMLDDALKEMCSLGILRQYKSHEQQIAPYVSGDGATEWYSVVYVPE